MAAFMSQYELERDARIASNKRKMQELGIFEAKAAFEELLAISQPAPARRVRKAKAEVPTEDLRRSTRDRPKVDYSEDDRTFNQRIPGQKSQRRVVQLSREDLDVSHIPSPKIRSKVDSGKGVRMQGGRVYDSQLGVTCHWCRQKTVESKVTCTKDTCGGGRRLPTSFCGRCLLNRHGEGVETAEASGKWVRRFPATPPHPETLANPGAAVCLDTPASATPVCPGCRGSCGAGCKLCCNCGPCRKKAGLPPTHQLIKEAREAKFDNVHDYLIHQSTGESAAQLAERKAGHAWFWMGKSEQIDQDAEQPRAEEKTKATKARVAAAVDEPFKVVKAAAAMGGGKQDSKDRAARAAARKLRAMTAVGLMAPTRS